MADEPTATPQPTVWGYPPPPPPPPPVREHPRATTALILGIIGLAGGVVFYLPLLISPVAWLMGRSAMKEIEASGGALGGHSNAKTGFILGVIGTAFLILSVLALTAFVIFAVSMFSHAFVNGPLPPNPGVGA